jgi:hypothetical protein
MHKMLQFKPRYLKLSGTDDSNDAMLETFERRNMLKLILGMAMIRVIRGQMERLTYSFRGGSFVDFLYLLF